MKKITNYKSQITKGVAPPAQKEFQIQNYKLQTLLWKRDTDDSNGARSQLAKNRRKRMVPMGNTLMKRGTMVDLV
jgi:hypothetical protein